MVLYFKDKFLHNFGVRGDAFTKGVKHFRLVVKQVTNDSDGEAECGDKLRNCLDEIHVIHPFSKRKERGQVVPLESGINQYAHFGLIVAPIRIYHKY